MYSLRKLRLFLQLLSFLSKLSLELPLKVCSQNAGLFQLTLQNSCSFHLLPSSETAFTFLGVCSSSILLLVPIPVLVHFGCHNKRTGGLKIHIYFSQLQRLRSSRSRCLQISIYFLVYRLPSSCRALSWLKGKRTLLGFFNKGTNSIHESPTFST